MVPRLHALPYNLQHRRLWKKFLCPESLLPVESEDGQTVLLSVPLGHSATDTRAQCGVHTGGGGGLS